MIPSSSYSSTSTLVEKLAAYLPSVVLPDPASSPVSFEGAALRAEIEGFATLAESLAKIGREGLDTLSRVLTGYFSPLLNLIKQYDGHVIAFDGTGLSVFFDKAEGQALDRAAKVGQLLIAANNSFLPVQTTEGRYSFQMRVGVAEGQLERLLLGSDLLGRALVFNGTAIDHAQQAQQAAAWGSVNNWSHTETAASVDAIEPATISRAALFREEDPTSVFNRLSPYLPRQLAQRLKATTGPAATTEFARVVNIFVQIDGIDLSGSEDKLELSEYYNLIQRICTGLDGRVHQVVLLPAENLICLHLTFGALLSTNDDATNALRAALVIRDVQTPTGQLPTIGIASGTVFSGTLGTAQRQSYTVLGEVVSLSNRFATAAREIKPGTILVDRYTRERVGLVFLFGEDISLNLPGRNFPVKAGQLLAVRPAAYTLHTFLREFPVTDKHPHEGAKPIDQALQGHRQVYLLPTLEAVAATAQHWLQHEGSGAIGTSMQNALGVPYLAWSGLLAGLIGLNDTGSRTEKAAKLAQAIAEFAPTYTAYTGWLNQLLGLTQEEPGFRQRISGAQQAQFANLIAQLILGLAEVQPLMLIFRDIQWSDPAGLDLLEQVAGKLENAPVLFCLTTSGASEEIQQRLKQLPGLVS